LSRSGKQGLSKAASSLAVWQGVGFSLGALLSGVIPLWQGYLLHIIIRIIILVTVIVITAAFLHEERCAEQKKRELGVHIKDRIAVLMKTRGLRYVLLCITGASVMMFGIETYWQPSFSTLIAANMRWLLGVLSALGFASTVLGSYIAGKIKIDTDKRQWIYYLAFLGGLAVCILLLAFQNSAAGFMTFYTLWYLVLGAVNVPEQTLINSMVTNSTRSSMLSTASLACQLGGIMSSILSAAVVGSVGYTGIFLFGAIASTFTLIYIAIRLSAKKLKMQ
jgi:predicted MFS family arabinose efflux permease